MRERTADRLHFSQPELELIKKLNDFRNLLSAPFVDRWEMAKVITLGIAAGEHVIIVGEPGTAKSEMSVRAAKLVNARFFKYQLSEFTLPEELLGPIDIKALEEKGLYQRITRNSIVEADMAFLDEAFKASSMLLNSMLQIFNERVKSAGYSDIDVNLKTMIAATNRIPPIVIGSDLDALYDRLILRHFTEPVPRELWPDLLRDALKSELTKGKEEVQPILNLDEIAAITKMLGKVDVSGITDKLIELLGALESNTGHPIHMTDRRKRRLLKVVAANALMDGRASAAEEDLLVLKYIAPTYEKDLVHVTDILAEHLDTAEKHIRALNKDINIHLDAISTHIALLKGSERHQIDIEKDMKELGRILTYARECKAKYKSRELHELADVAISEVGKLSDGYRRISKVRASRRD